MAGALLTGVFGSADVVEAFLGEDADSGIALATVGSAIATGFVGAGAVVLLALRNGKGTTTVAGLLVAAAVTTAGAFGQLWVGFWSGLDFELDGIQYVLMAALVLAMALLLVYAWRTFTLNLAEGTDPPEPEPQKDYLKPPLSETIFATRMLVEALMARDDIPHSTADELLKRLPSLHAVETYPAYGNSPGDDPPRPRRRAALL